MSYRTKSIELMKILSPLAQAGMIPQSRFHVIVRDYQQGQKESLNALLNDVSLPMGCEAILGQLKDF